MAIFSLKSNDDKAQNKRIHGWLVVVNLPDTLEMNIYLYAVVQIENSLPREGGCSVNVFDVKTE